MVVETERPLESTSWSRRPTTMLTSLIVVTLCVSTPQDAPPEASVPPAPADVSPATPPPPADTPLASPRAPADALLPTPRAPAKAPLATPSAPAQVPLSTPAESPRSYASKLALADGAAWAVIIAGFAGNSFTAIGLGTAALELTGPMVHLANHQPGRALGSFALRAGGSLAAFLYGVTSSDAGDLRGLVGFVTGIVGLLAGEILDYAVIGGRPRKKTTVAAQSSEGSGFVVVPVVAPAPNGGFLGVTAVF